VEPYAFAALVTPEGEGTRAVQLYRAILSAIREGRAAGALPSSRAAAEALGLSRNTVNAAYELLRAEGAIAVAPGAAPRILPPPPLPPSPAPGPTPPLSARGHQLAAEGRPWPAPTLFAPGRPDEALFPRDLWALALRRAARQPQGAAFAYGEFSGLPSLRAALARRLAADRGMRVSPEQVLVTPGAKASLTLLAVALAGPGDAALIEEPGYNGARSAFGGAGLGLSPLPVDGVGADPDRADWGCSPRLIYVTPANQYPLGARLTLARRAALLARAAECGALVIEDDYDSEFHWEGRALPALQGSAPDQVAALGTASKALMPALRLGWIVAPPALAGALAAVQRALGLGANIHAQGALADLIESGQYRAQLHRISRTYGERGRAFAAALRRLPIPPVADPTGGVQLTIRLPEGVEARAVAALNAAGFGPVPLSAFCIGEAQEGLVAGFAQATPERIARFCEVLTRAL